MRITKDINKASALVMVAGILMVLSSLGICFVKFTNTERSAATNYLNRVRADLAAEAGFWRALSELKNSCLYKSISSPNDDWVYQGNKRGSPGVGVPIEQAVYPSYWWIGDKPYTDSKPAPLPVYGRSVSGVLGGSYEPQGDTYTLKIFDTSSQINLNSASVSLASTLNYLGQAISYYNGGVNPMVVKGISRGADIVAYRELLGGKFTSKESLSQVIGETNSRIIWDYVTVNSWVDHETLARDPNKGESGYWISEPRAPININTASKPVLVAVLAGLSSENGVESISFAQAVRVADAIKKYNEIGGIFKSWSQFNVFIDILSTSFSVNRNPSPQSLVLNQLNNNGKDERGEYDKSDIFSQFMEFRGILNEAQGNIIKANANPNVSVRRFNPDKVLYQPIDKTDLTYHTTEFCFDSTGYYEILSLGQITSNGGNIRGHSLIYSVAKVYSTVKHNSQSDFRERWDETLSQNTTLYLNNLNHRSEDSMGYMSLLPQECFPADPQKGTNFLTFNANFTSDLNAYFAKGNHAPCGVKRKDGSTPLSVGGDLAADGVLIREAEEKSLAYESSENLPLDEGYISFWVEYNENAKVMETPLWFADSPFLSPDAGIQTMIQVSINDGTLFITATRMLYVKADIPNRLDYPYPYKYRSVKIMTELYDKDNYISHKWNNISIGWKDGTDLKLYINGKESGTALRQDHDEAKKLEILPSEGIPVYEPLIYLGKDPQNPPSKTLTMDDIQIYSKGDIDFKEDDLYRHKPIDEKINNIGIGSDFITYYDIKSFYGKFRCSFKLPTTRDGYIKIGPMTWTTMYPVTSDDIFFNDIEIYGGGIKKEAGKNLDGPVIIKQDEYIYEAYFFRALKDPSWYLMPKKGTNDSPVFEDITLYYQEPLTILSYRFIGE